MIKREEVGLSVITLCTDKLLFIAVLLSFFWLNQSRNEKLGTELSSEIKSPLFFLLLLTKYTIYLNKIDG